MGSEKTSRFTDYPGSSGGLGSGGDKGQAEDDPCFELITTELEDIERSEYFRTHQSFPAQGSGIQVILQGRLTVTTLDGVIIGLVPTQHNSLAGCIKHGLAYGGTIVVTSARPIPRVVVNITPQ